MDTVDWVATIKAALYAVGVGGLVHGETLYYGDWIPTPIQAVTAATICFAVQAAQAAKEADEDV